MRVIIALILIALLVGGVMWYNQNQGAAIDVDGIRADLPSVEMGTGTTTVTVPTDADVVRGDNKVGVEVTTEERTIEYPTVNVEPAANDTATTDSTVTPINEDPNDPVPPANQTISDENNDGDLDIGVDNDANSTNATPGAIADENNDGDLDIGEDNDANSTTP